VNAVSDDVEQIGEQMVPNFDVSAITTEEELAITGKRTLIEEITEVSLDDIRKAVHEGVGHSAQRDKHFTGVVRLDEETPQNLFVIINYLSGVAGMVITITPDQFDRSDPEQEELYQKFLGIVRIHAEAPVNTRRERDTVDVGTFEYACYLDQEEVDQWTAVLERWTADGT
jgi:hypothetical protein